MNKKVCFTALVYGKYQKYIPYFIYSCLHIHKFAFVKIYYIGAVSEKILKTLESLKQKGYSNFEICKPPFEDYSIFDDYKIKGGGTNTLFRYLFKYEDFKEFEYVYFGDIDILFLEEKVSFLDYHLGYFNKHNIPFSNIVRRDDDGNLTQRLTGLHFVKVKEYFSKTDAIVKKIIKNIEYRI